MRALVGSTMVAILALAPALLGALSPGSAWAQQVFDGDPVDPGTGLAYPVMPGLPLLLPGNDEEFGSGDDVIDSGITGDIDLVVRAGDITAATIPPPALASGGAPIATMVAGGGSSGQGSEVDFTIMVSDGAGLFGNVITSADMDLRPATVYAFADLDGDGVLGPTNADGSADNSLELQEVTAYGGRQMGGLDGGRFSDSLGIEMGAPASLGGLTVGLVAGAYSGSSAEALFTDGPLVLTRWPFFPPLDPQDLLGGGVNPAPEPDFSNQLEWDIEANYLPSPGHPTLGTFFAVAVDGGEPTTDQLLVHSAPAVSARLFVEPVAGDFVARARPRLRVAPASGGSGRTLVLPVDRAVLAADGAASALTLRVLPTDLFGNIADPTSPILVSLSLSGGAAIVAPDLDGNPRTEVLSLEDAAGTAIVLDDDGLGSGALELSVDGAPAGSVAVEIGAGSDSDGDGVADDGNGSGVSGDTACDASASSCDDNCPRVINPSQVDSNHDGLGDCCDGTCVDDPLSDSCDECALPAQPGSGAFTSVSASLRLGGGEGDDRLRFKLQFTLAPGASIAPDAETVALVVTQSGSNGYSATLPSAYVDLTRAVPFFRYSDREGTLDGVLKSQLKARSDGSWKMMLRARGLSLADLVSGNTGLILALGEDVLEGTLVCAGAASRIHCELAP